MSQKGIQWIFNPPAASHHGGVWERQIRTIRKQQNVDDEGLQTVLCEVEAIVNDRPITKTSDDPNDTKSLTVVKNTRDTATQVHSKKIFTHAGFGTKCSISRIYSGPDGLLNTCLNYKNVKNGLRPTETCR
ncbi:hypothetical protein M9458_057839 [Cirrhinus mrigala]|uniref:Uncharacterized protein n=1 Tax=Cirrhinus mrigala TaxID=683832 RepID=A0ABD0MAM7_CIRMR